MLLPLRFLVLSPALHFRIPLSLASFHSKLIYSFASHYSYFLHPSHISSSSKLFFLFLLFPQFFLHSLRPSLASKYSCPALKTSALYSTLTHSLFHLRVHFPHRLSQRCLTCRFSYIARFTLTPVRQAPFHPISPCLLLL